MNDCYKAMLRKRTASAAIGAATIRKLAKAGTIGPARSFLAEIDLTRFVAISEDAFKAELDSVTMVFAAEVEISWGVARKFLNIFLRDCLYNEWVRDDFSLARIEEWLEVPLDSHVAKGLKKDTGTPKLPRWRGVKTLEATTSAEYQAAAHAIAAGEAVARVHLDIKYWRADELAATPA